MSIRSSDVASTFSRTNSVCTTNLDIRKTSRSRKFRALHDYSNEAKRKYMADLDEINKNNLKTYGHDGFGNLNQVNADREIRKKMIDHEKILTEFLESKFENIILSKRSMKFFFNVIYFSKL